MRASLLVALLALVAALCVTDAKKVVVFSGGGIRATVGTVIGMQLLTDLQYAPDEWHATSGGSWGVIDWFKHKNFNAFYRAAKDELAQKKHRTIRADTQINIGPDMPKDTVFASNSDNEAYLNKWSEKILQHMIFVDSMPEQMTEFNPGKMTCFYVVERRVANKKDMFHNLCGVCNNDRMHCLSPIGSDAIGAANVEYTIPYDGTTKWNALRASVHSSSAWAKTTLMSLPMSPTHILPVTATSGPVSAQFADGGLAGMNLPALTLINAIKNGPVATTNPDDYLLFDYTGDKTGATGKMFDRIIQFMKDNKIDYEIVLPYVNGQGMCRGQFSVKGHLFSYIGFCGVNADKDLGDEFKTTTGKIPKAVTWDQAMLDKYVDEYTGHVGGSLEALKGFTAAKVNQAITAVRAAVDNSLENVDKKRYAKTDVGAVLRKGMLKPKN